MIKLVFFFLICEFYTNFMNFVGDSAEKIEVDPENFEIISILSGYIELVFKISFIQLSYIFCLDNHKYQ